MPSLERCPRCGTELREGAGPEELCPRCLLALGLEAPSELSGETPDVSEPGTVSWLSREVPERIAPYRLLSSLGEGGMGMVYLAEQEAPIRRRVALKLIKRGMDSREVIARFESERQALALMSHPGIAQVFDAGTSEAGLPYFVMEHVKGVPITEYCDRHQLSAGQRLELFIEVCEAIQHAHQKGIIHRDIKPTNVLVTVEEGKPRPKVIDFGVAKAISQRLTEKTVFTNLGVMIGTPGYMSPEQAEVTGLDVDTRSDIYSLGVLAYELLVGMLPFDPRRLREAGWAEMQRIIREEEPPRPSTRVSTLGEAASDMAKRRRTDPLTLARGLRGDLDWITLKALEKDRARRYQSASELAADVRRHLNNEPVAAGPPDLRYRLTKAVKRNKGAFAAVAAVAAAVVIGLIVATVLYIRAEAARKETRRQVVRLYVKEGMRLAEENDRMSALPWLVEALRLEEHEPDRREAHRYRIAATLAHLPALKALWAHAGAVRAAVFNADATAVATASADHTARVWNVASGEAISPPLQHEGPVESASFSPDGARVVTASEDGTARVWDAITGRSLLVLKHGGPVKRALFTPDGTKVVTASADDTAVVWDAQSGRPLTTVRHGDDVISVDVSHDGRSMLTASLDRTARLWDLASGRPQGSPLRGSSPVTSAGFSRDGRRVVTTNFDWSARVWDGASGAPLTPPLHHAALFADFSPDGRWVAVTAGDNAIHVWDVETGARVYPPTPLSSIALVARFSADGLLLVTGDHEGRVQLWRAATGEPVGVTLRHAGGLVLSASFDPTGRFLLTSSEDWTARLWDLATTEPVHPPLPPPLGRPMVGVSRPGFFARDGRTVFTPNGAWDFKTGDRLTPPLPADIRLNPSYESRLSADGRLLATALGHTARAWKVGDGEPLGPPLVHEGWVSDYDLDAQGKRLLTIENSAPFYFASGEGPARAHVWDVGTGNKLLPPLGHDRALFEARFTRDGLNVITAGAGQVRIWNAASGSPVSPPLPGGVRPSLALSLDGGRLAVASEGDYMLRVWSVPAGELLAGPREESALFGVEFSPDGTRMATKTGGGAVQIWDGRTAERLGSSMMHKGLVYTSQFSSDGRWLLTSSIDTTARVWDAASGEPVTPPYRDAKWAAFSPDGRRLFTGNLGARVWDLELDARPVEDLGRLASLLASRRIVGATSLVSLTAQELAEAWRVVRTRQPEASDASALQLQAWHRAKADSMVAEGRWREALVHLDKAIALGPPRWALLMTRGRIHAELNQWRESVSDHEAALGLIPGELEATYALGLGRLLAGEHQQFGDVRKSLVDRWSHTQNPDRARWAAHAMVLAPIEGETARARALKWAETAIGHDRSEELILHGAALYRAGRYKLAALELEKALAEEEGPAPAYMAGKVGSASAPVLLAMACRRLGRVAEAQRWLLRSERDLAAADAAQARRMQRPGRAPESALDWWQREELRLLLREARGEGPRRP